MGNRIVRALDWALSLLLPSGGRHGADPPIQRSASDRPAAHSWAGPSVAATPHRVAERLAPLWADELPLVRPYVLAAEADRSAVQRERQLAAELAALDVDYRYAFAGAPFPATFLAGGVAV